MNRPNNVSWADEAEDFERVSAMDGEIPVIINGQTELWKKQDALESLQTFAPQRLYCVWGNGAEVARDVFAPIVLLTGELESVKDLIRTRDAGACFTRKPSEEECVQLSISFLCDVFSLLTELSRVFRVADDMMIPLDPRVEGVQARIAAVAEDHSPSYKNCREGRGRKGTAARLKEAFLERNRAYCAHASAVVAIARAQVQDAHRKLVEFRIRFDKANPDVAALLGR